jgi:hypothetical protein
MSGEAAGCGGAFAPGHLGELTQVVPFEMVDEVLAECGAGQRRLRKLPARVVVYLLLAGALFAECGYVTVWGKLTAGLDTSVVPQVTAAALWQGRSRLGYRPLRALFDLLRGPATGIRDAGARWHGLLVTAIDGTYLDAPDVPAVVSWLGRSRNQYAGSPYPQVCLLVLAACGTRAVMDAVFGPRSAGEAGYGRQLARSLGRDMIVLLDRGFDAAAFLQDIAGAGAHFLVRVAARRKPPVLRRLPDGSFLSLIGSVQVRIIDARITAAGPGGTVTGSWRLATTLLDHRQYPALEVIRLYHERWEIEIAYYGIKESLLGGRVLRARSHAGIIQEIYALLTLYQAIRIAIADAAGTAAGTDPDRASFTIALQTARDQVTAAAGITAGTTIDLAGAIGRAVLARPLPARRCRRSPRTVKRPLSRYGYGNRKTDRRSHTVTISIDLLTPAPSP